MAARLARLRSHGQMVQLTAAKRRSFALLSGTMADPWLDLLWHASIVIEIEGGRYLLAAGGVALLLWLFRKWAEPRRIQRRRATFADRRRELLNSAVTLLMFSGIGVLILLMAQAGMIRILPGAPPWWLLALELAAVILLHDAYFYWMHRAIHDRRLFRRVHKRHHLSQTPTPWAAYSFSASEGVLQAVFLPLYLLLVPMHLVTVIVFTLHQIGRNALGHAGFELMPPGFSRHPATGWLTTTTHHDLHHSGGRYNYGLYFTHWDRWMGTEHPEYHQRFEAAAKPWLRRREPQPAPSAPAPETGG